MARHLLLAAILGAFALPVGCSCAPVNLVDRLGDPLPAGAVARLGTVRFRDGRGTWAVALSPDGKTLATGSMPGSADGAVSLWDVATGRQLRALVPGANNILSLAWSPDGKQLAVAHDHRCELWDAATGTLVRELDRNPRDVGYWSLRWSGDGGRLAAYEGGSREATIWTLPEGQKKIVSFPDKIEALDLSRDGRLLAGGGKEFAIVEDLGTGQRVFERTKGDYETFAIAFSPDSKSLAAAFFLGGERAAKAQAGEVWHWPSLNDPGYRLTRTYEPNFGELVFAEQGRTLVLNRWWHAIHRWNLADKKELPTVESPNAIGRFCSVDAAGTLVATSESSAGVWRVADGQEVNKLEAHRANVRRGRFTADGQAILSASADQTLRAWNAADGAPLGCVELPNYATLLEPLDKDAFVLGGSNFLERLEWPSLARTPLVPADKLPGAWMPHALSPDKKLVAMVVAARPEEEDPDDREHEMRIFDLAQQAFLPLSLPMPAMTTSPCSFSHDSRRLIVARGTSLSVLEVESGKESASMPMREFWGYAVSSEAPLVAYPRFELLEPPSVLLSGELAPKPGVEVQIVGMDYETQREAWRLTDPSLRTANAWVNRLRLSPDGRLLAVCDHSRILLFSPAAGRLIATLQGHRDAVSDFDFSPDGKRLVSASQDTTLLVWDLSGL